MDVSGGTSSMDVSHNQQEPSKQVCNEDNEPCIPPDNESCVVDDEPCWYAIPPDNDKHNDYEPCWADLPLDALANIFSFLCIYDMLAIIPLVCRTWRRISHDPVCWKTVDLSKWSPYKGRSKLEKMLLLVGNRSQGGLKQLLVNNLSNDNLLQIIASSSGQQLEVLRIPKSLVSGDFMCEVAPKLSSLTYLDLSSCASSRASIESLGKHCKFLTRLNLSLITQTCASSNDIVHAVAEYLPQLKHFEMACGWFSNPALRALLEKCTHLEYLDIRGCFNVNMEDSCIKDATKRLKVFHPPRKNIDTSITRLDINSPTTRGAYSDASDDPDYDGDSDYDDDLDYDDEYIPYGSSCTCDMEDEKSDIDYEHRYISCGMEVYKLVRFPFKD